MMDVAESLNMWWPTLEKQVTSRWQILLYSAHQRLRHPERYAEQDTDEEVDPQTVRQQTAEARALANS